MTGAGHWQSALDAFLAREEPACVTQVRVLEQAQSTQDVAAGQCRGEGGLLIVALVQTAGRGRLGRRWLSLAGRGVTMTLTVRAAGERATVLPIAVGVAVAEAVVDSLRVASRKTPIGIRWPNDVVERERGRKLAGILIESPSPGLYLVGIGVNVEHRDDEWPSELQGRACSIAQLGGEQDRVRVIELLVRRLDAMLGRAPMDDMLARWRAFDVLCGKRITVSVGERTVCGLAEAVEPTSHLVLRTETGVERVPAATTSLLSIEGSSW